MKQTCQQVFQDAVAERRQYPLYEGLFKLREGRHSLQAFADEIQTIAAFKRKEVDKHQLQMCQTREIAQWLRSMPANVAHLLGRTVLPAFSALGADGVPLSEVAKLQKDAAVRINRIVARLDLAQQTLAELIVMEYDRMLAGVPTLAAEVQEVLDLIDSTISHCLPWVNASIPDADPSGPA